MYLLVMRSHRIQVKISVCFSDSKDNATDVLQQKRKPDIGCELFGYSSDRLFL